TTHLGALKQLAGETVGIVNASLQFAAETLTPTYRLLKGVPGRSYGLAIARRLGIAADVLDMAERAVPDAERGLDALLATVETGGGTAGDKAGEGGKGKGWVSLEDLKRTRGKPAPIARPPDRLTAAVATAEVSLRGLRVDEAEARLVKALDDAVLADLPYLRVIHGKGTGAVRERVHEVLAADPRVQRF